MSKKVKINKKRLVTILVVVIVVIIAIIMIVKNVNKDKNEITLDGTTTNIENKTITNEQQIEYDGNPYNVPQDYTQTVSGYVDDSNNEMSGDEISQIKRNIEEKFKSVSTDKLGISANMDSIVINFNPVTTTIAEKKCLVFAVYTEENNELNFVSKYAMSVDASTLYKFDSEKLIYNMIEM